MKKCQQCLAENREEANFCEKCGKNFVLEQLKTDTTVESNSRRQRHKKQSLWIVASIGIVVTMVIFFSVSTMFVKNKSAKIETAMTTTQTTTSSTEKTTRVEKATGASNTSNDSVIEQQFATYDSLIKEASELTAKGEYQASSLKLTEIPAALLTNVEYKALQTLVENLTELNTIGVQEQKNATEYTQHVSSQSSTTSTFVGEFSKWADTYFFYYGQSEQKQLFLTILTDGWVTQTNYDGTQYFGQATITKTSGSVLSYNTDQLYPIEQPETKRIQPNIKITIQWMNNGGTQELYGYLSYSSRMVLTDGRSKSFGVNEVWITN